MDDFGIIDSLDYEDIDDDLIDHENDVHRSRENLIDKLFRSEEAYVQSLELVMSLFLIPLRKDSTNTSFNFLGMKKMICTEREFRWLFGNFEEIVHVHRLTLKSLQESLDCYHTYLSNYAVTLTTYERLSRYQPFKKFIDSVHKDKSLKGSTLLSLIQLPIGCIDRYVQIIAQIAESTSPMHPDYTGLQKIKAWIQQFHSSIKEKLVDASNVEKVLMIHQALIGAPFSVRAERRLIMEGQLSRIMPNAKSSSEERYYLLFSDFLVFVRTKTTKLQYKGHLILERARIRPLTKEEAGGFPNCIEITSSFSGVDNLNTTFIGAPTVHVLHADTEENRNRWLYALEKVIVNLDKMAAAKHGKRK
ncbi:Dbl homology domain-containing protein [Mycotypha africana]|uniref:rho guanine nucleotide exchange factor n=1 Tax=Mycotypha africana TaxID=64632 RepID=UPI0023004F24|nr:rho guanine nucleotide exchange factor [Mycotypha africana]KAI8982118.1 Dbl homology domain-containing protein [Mycotypha africana]